MTFKINLGRAGSKPVVLDAYRLLETRALVCGSSGCGKSWLLRLIAEQTAPQLPTLVLDPEGEFVTLREAVDVALVSADGDVRPAVGAAATIARRLLELGTSAVVALDDLAPVDRQAFVRGFISGLMDAPRSAWRPLLVVLDEAHDYAPQSGDASSGVAVARLLSQGRKRGFGTILSTQRLSKLHKDAAAECSNVMVGRTTLGIDLARARDLLGLRTQNEARELRRLKPGHWHAVGPALEPDDAGELVAGAVRTTHPEPGHRHELRPPAPSTRLRRKLRELADVAEQTQSEILTLDQAKARISELELEHANGRAAVSSAELAAAVGRARTEGLRAGEQQARRAMAVRLSPLAMELEQLGRAIRREEAWLRERGEGPGPEEPAATSSTSAPVKSAPPSPAPTRAASGGPRGGLRRMLVTLAQHPEGCDRRRLALLARLSTRGGTFGTYLSSGRVRGWLLEQDGRLTITAKGLAAIGDIPPLPRGRELVEYWLGWCGGGGARRMLEALLAAGPRGIAKDELAKRAQVARQGGTFGTYLSKLRTAGLIEGDAELRAVGALLEGT